MKRWPLFERRVRELKGDQRGPLTGGGARSSDLESLLPTKLGQGALGCADFSGGFLAQGQALKRPR